MGRESSHRRVREDDVAFISLSDFGYAAPTPDGAPQHAGAPSILYL